MAPSEQANAGLLKEFLVESAEGLAVITELLPRMEKEPGNTELLASVYRAMHTLKGAACFLHFEKLQKVTHAGENLLEFIKKGQIAINPEVIDTLLGVADLLGSMLNSIETTSKEGDVNIDVVVKRLNAFILGKGKSASSSQEPVPATQEVAMEPKAVEKSTTAVGKTPTNAPANTGPSEAEGRSSSDDSCDSGDKGKKSVSDSVVRVNVNLLDKMMNVVGELVLNRNQILQFAGKFDNPELNRLASQLNLITSELQTDIMTTRMQPIGTVLNKFERIVRDLARDSKKRINVRIEGKETELDKTLLEAIKDPLTHLVRNSVDHGIEVPEDREKVAKRPEGLLTIRAYHEGGQVTIEIQDDGRGLNKEKILNKAIKNGLITAEQSRTMSDKQIQDLIFLPGLSTAEKVTNLSGRGVGMDVVKTNIERIGGVVDVSSKENEGTTFKLRVPLTLAIVPALLVIDGGDYFAIPQVSLVELVLLEGDRLKELECIQGSEFFRLRGELLPVVRLKNVLDGIKPGAQNAAASADSSVNILVLSADGRNFGLIVDAIEDTQEIVVKPLKLLKSLSVYSGATIMGDGTVALILDTSGIANWTNLAMVNQESKTDSVETSKAQLQEMLLFRLQDRALYGVPLCLINRLEEIDSKDIEMVGNKIVLRYRDHVMPLIDVSERFGVGKVDLNQESLPLLVLYLNRHYFGLLVHEITDIAASDFNIHPLAAEQRGIMGSLFIGDRTVTVIDTFEVIDQAGQDGLAGTINPALREKAKARTVLVVDDSALFRKMSIDVLEAQGYTVLAAADGSEALEMLENEKVDLLLSDIDMPVMDGFSLAKAIKDHQKLKALPMVALTSRSNDDDRQKGLSCGYIKYLEKFRREEVVGAVNELLLRTA